MPASVKRKWFNAQIAHHLQLIGKWEERVVDITDLNDQSPAGLRAMAHAKLVLQEQYDNSKRFLNRYGKQYGYQFFGDAAETDEESGDIEGYGSADPDCDGISGDFCMTSDLAEVPDFCPGFLLHSAPSTWGKKHKKKSKGSKR